MIKFFLLAGMVGDIGKEVNMIKFSKIQAIIWAIMALVTGLSAETMVNDMVSFALILILFSFFVAMAYLNFTFYEELKETIL